ncbi:MAG: TonB-dependent receptor [Acidobacteria bacterium]|nr:TonB-dependent receptor [Acidobacteriota bacterium]
MSFRHRTLSRTALPVFTLFALLLINPALYSQTKQLMNWMGDLNYLQLVPDEELLVQKPAVEQIRNAVELWIKMHPSSKVQLGPAPAQPWGAAEIRKQVSALHAAVQAILKEDPSRPFELGVTTVSVTSEASPLSPLTDSINRTEIQNLQATTVSTALDYLPGLTLERTSARNEMKVRLRGFTSQGQFPLYMDGIPMQVPYDGRLDFNRFLTNDIAEIEVAKGYSSPLLGANNLGGSINLITRQPQKAFEADAAVGTGSGEQFLGSLQLGSRIDKFYLQGSVDWMQREYFPLSGKFPLQRPTTPAPRYQTTYKRNESDTQDAKYAGRIAFTPRGRDQYVFTYINQKGVKSTPLYAGPNLDAFNRYWRWPYWNKYSYYFQSNTGVGEASDIKLRVYFDQFKNGLRGYDDDTYTTQKKKSAFISDYDDHSQGAAIEFLTRILPRNSIGLSFNFKDDTHNSTDFLPSKTPTEVDRSQTFSMGFQDIITITSKLRATFGLNIDNLKGLHAQQYNSSKTAMLPLTCKADPENDSFRGCLPDVWTASPQVSISYNLSNRNTLFVTFADRSRFPLLSEFYSAKFLSSLANPDLKPEKSRNWDIGFSHAFGSKTLGQIQYFHNSLRNSIHSVNILDEFDQCPGSKIVGYCGMNVNIASESHQGFEMSLRTTPVRQFTLDANYSYINRSLIYKWEDMPDVSKLYTTIDLLVGMPRHRVIINATGELPRKMLAMFTYRYEGGITLQDTTYTPVRPAFGTGFGTVDIGTVVPLYEGLSVQAGIKNLFDWSYYYTAGYPEMGRNWYFNMRYRF